MPQVEIQKKMYDLKAQVKRIDGFSGHADKEELLNYIDNLKLDNLKKIFLVHGDKESKESLKEALEIKGLNVEILKEEKVYKL
jgi:metallo-beta-lactamase family protein